MAYIQCNFWSEVLGKCCDMTVLLPQRAPVHPETRRGKTVARRTYPVLYLLHGLCGDHRTWLANTNLEHLAQNSNLAIVMPDAGLFEAPTIPTILAETAAKKKPNIRQSWAGM